MEITNHNITEFLASIKEPRKSEISTIVDLMHEVTGKAPKLWGSIIGFGNLHYKYESGTEGNMPLLGVANRKQAITLYITYSIDKYQEEFSKLGKFASGKSCLYVKKLSDIDLDVLKEIMIKTSKDTLNINFISDNDE
ncbi:MAG TPA: DUF1801 domain-containing protein [Acholeplasma sp.]|nr:DUF1801 domain-containing protein [Acholeplasma sp.]